MCRKHGSKAVACSVVGCSTNAAARGVCSKHGALGTCAFNNCTTAVKARGRCTKHGGGSRKDCKEEGCTARAAARGLCRKHGAYGTCKFARCTTNAYSYGSPYCSKHGGGGKRKPCSVAGCTTASALRDLCKKHGGGPGKCVFGGCTNVMKSTKRKTCHTHGGLGYCNYTEPGGDILLGKCLTPAIKWGGNCKKHTGKYVDK